jgi:hypothetical protein
MKCNKHLRVVLTLYLIQVHKLYGMTGYDNSCIELRIMESLL